MEISCQLICPCNNKLYKSQISLKAHYKTQGHQYYEKNKEQKDYLIKVNRLENENGHLRRLNILLLERISELEKTKN